MIVTGVMFLNLGIHMTDLTQLYVIASSCEAECDTVTAGPGSSNDNCDDDGVED